MRDHEQKYYLVKSGEVKRRAEEYRATYLRLSGQLWKVVESFGAEEASIDKCMMLIRGIAFKGAPPVGWTKPKHGVSRPKRGTLGPDMRRFFTPDGGYLIEQHAELKPFLAWLNCPFHYTYKTKEGGWGSSHLGRLFADSVVYWYDKDGPIMLELPDVAKAKEELEKRGETADNNALGWTPPKGLKEILPEEWDLMAAKHKQATSPHRLAGRGE